MVKYENVLVLGGTGFLGKNLQKVKPDWTYAGRSYFVEKGVKCDHQTDFLDYNSVYDIINGINPDAVINLVADVGGIKYNEENQLSIFENNMLMNINIIKACRELEIDRVLSALSTCVFPDGGSYPMNEDELFLSVAFSEPTPWTDSSCLPALIEPFAEPFKGHRGYGWSKRMLQIHTELAREAGYNYSTFTPSNLYGPDDHIGQEGSHFVAALIHKLAALPDSPQIGILEMFGDGTPLRQFLFAPDLALIIPILLEEHNSGIPLIVAPDENLSIADMIEQACVAVNKDVQIQYTHTHNGQHRKDCLNTKLKELIGDFGFTKFSYGFKETYDWYKRNK